MMFFGKILACALAICSLTDARPAVKKRALNDIDILQFALTLEHLEAAFYKLGFSTFPPSKFSELGFSQETYDGLVAIGATEAVHVDVLSSVITSLGSKPVPPCTYKFGLTTAAGFVQTARILEAVGIAAYLGAAPLIDSKGILSAAGSIVTVEARHQTFIRTTVLAKPVPQAFDAAIGPRQIFTLASAFISSCPKEADLGIKPFPPLTVQASASGIASGSVLKMTVPGGAGSYADPLTCAFVSGDKGLQVVEFKNGACTVPDGIGGEVFLTLTTAAPGAKEIPDDKVVAGPAVLVIS